MMPRVLDLFSGQGGAAMGYMRAGFAVTGVDTKRIAHRYPGDFIRGDALEVLIDRGHKFDVIHASPPCQAYTRGLLGNEEARAKHPRLIPVVRDLLEETGKPWVIENVHQAMDEMVDPVMLCGSMFKLHAYDEDGTPLEMWRHRLFESNLELSPPSVCKHNWFSGNVAGSYGGARRDRHEAKYVRGGGYVPSKKVQEQLLDIYWMSERGLFQSIPPAFTEHLGNQIMRSL